MIAFALVLTCVLHSPRFELHVAVARLVEVVPAPRACAGKQEMDCRAEALEHLKSLQKILARAGFQQLSALEFQLATDHLEQFDYWFSLHGTLCTERARAVNAALDLFAQNPPKARGEDTDYTQRWYRAHLDSTRTRINKRYAEIFARMG